MYHGIPINSELIAIVFGVIVWILRGIIRGVRQMKGRGIGSASLPSQAPPPSQAPAAQALTVQAPPPSQAFPMRAAPLVPAGSGRERPRQPQAGGPAVPREATSRDFQRQEQEMIASEAAAYQMPLQSDASAGSATQPNSLFSGTDDLVRAIILQEVLGPPLSRRAPARQPSSDTPP